MIHLLDTDTLIGVIRGLKSTKRPAHRERAEAVLERCTEAQRSGDSVGLSAITVCELCSSSYELEMRFVQRLLAPFDIYDFDAVTCPAHYGRICHHLESRGLTIGSMDVLIAAQALALDAVLVTNNPAHFSRIPGLQVANWLSTP